MPGANYMGGKRNAAKARSKDSTGRIQKGFFSKRRLDMLSQGLAPNRSDHGAPVYAGTRESGRSDIELAHAKQRINSRQDIMGFIPSPTRFSPRTPNSRKYSMRFNQTFSSSNSTRSSKVIEALDASEPLFFRAIMDRILALPDLAGLTGHCAQPAAPTTSTGYKCSVPSGGRGREKGPSPNTRKHKKQRTSSCENEKFASGSFISRQGRVDCLKEEHNLTSDGSPHISPASVSPFRPIINQADLDVAQEEFWSLDIDDDDVGYSDFRAGLDSDYENFDGEGRTTSSPKKGFRIVSSSGQPSSPSFGGCYPDYMNARFPSPKTPDPRQAGGYAQSLGSFLDDSPASKNGIPGRATHKFKSNNLFDHDDPWHTIGVILGLSPASQTGDMTNNLDNEAIAIKSRAKSPDMMPMTYEMSLPPSSPPADYSTPSKYHIPDRLTSSPELFRLEDDHADLLSTRVSNSSLVGSSSVSTGRFPSSPRFGSTCSCSPLAKAPLTTDHKSSPDMTGYSPTSFAPTMIHNFNSNFSDTDHTHPDPNNFGSMSNNISTPSSRSSTNRVKVLNIDDTSSDTKSYTAAASTLASCAPSLSSPGVFCATPVRSMPRLGDFCDLVDPLSIITPQTPLVPPSSVAGKAPSINVLDKGSLHEAVMTSSSSSKRNRSFSLQLTEVNGIFQGPCLFPEDPELDSDGGESQDLWSSGRRSHRT